MPVLIVLQLGISSIFSSSVSAAGNESIAAVIDLSSPALSRRNSALMTTTEELLQKIGKNTAPLLVAVRSPKKFDRARISNSPNIPLPVVKAKAFLKNLDFVLINGGATSRYIIKLFVDKGDK